MQVLEQCVPLGGWAQAGEHSLCLSSAPTSRWYQTAFTAEMNRFKLCLYPCRVSMPNEEDFLYVGSLCPCLSLLCCHFPTSSHLL